MPILVALATQGNSYELQQVGNGGDYKDDYSVASAGDMTAFYNEVGALAAWQAWKLTTGQIRSKPFKMRFVTSIRILIRSRDFIRPYYRM